MNIREDVQHTVHVLCHDVGQFLELKPDENKSKITAKDLILGDSQL